jgi:hypothetical protein
MDGLEFHKQLAGVSNAKGLPIVMITIEDNTSGDTTQAVSQSMNLIATDAHRSRPASESH